MSTSYSVFKQEVKNWIYNNFNKRSRILDVGSGCGTYWYLLHEKFKNIDSIEVFKPNIEKFNLKNKYQNVYNCDIKDFQYEYYDLIIFGDVLEHLTVKEAQNSLDYAYDRCYNLIVAVPYMYEQGICEDNIYEIHKQPDLTPENVLERYPNLKLLYGNEKYGYYIKR